MPSDPQADAYAGFHFELRLNGLGDDGEDVSASFSEVSGLDVELAPIEYRDGSEDITIRKLPGIKKFSNITLKRGVSRDASFWRWIVDAASGELHRSEGSIALLDERGREVMRWTFKQAWPCKRTGPGLNSKNDSFIIESLEIAHEGLAVES